MINLENSINPDIDKKVPVQIWESIVFYLILITCIIFINFINNLLNSFMLKFNDFYKYKYNLENVIKVW
jgi:hypothetical protein